jgi:hypothetical protein
MTVLAVQDRTVRVCFTNEAWKGTEKEEREEVRVELPFKLGCENWRKSVYLFPSSPILSPLENYIFGASNKELGRLVRDGNGPYSQIFYQSHAGLSIF